MALSYAVYRGAFGDGAAGQVDQIVVHGNQRLSKGEVLAVLSGLRGESLFWTDLDVWRRRLMRRPGCATPRSGDRCRRRSTW